MNTSSWLINTSFAVVSEVVPTRSVARKSTAKRPHEAINIPIVVNANIPKPLKEPSEGKIEVSIFVTMYYLLIKMC